MLVRSLVLPLAALLAIRTAVAQQAGLIGPVSGYLFDSPTSGIRPIIGFAGSAHLGPSIMNGVDLASVAPNGVNALVTRGGQLSAVSALTGAVPAITPLDAPFSSSTIASWAQDGSRVVFASAPDGASVQSVRWTDGAPTLDPPLDLSSIGGAVSSLVVDSIGKRILIGIRDDTVGGVYLSSDSGLPTQLAAMADPSALALSPDGAIAIAVDRRTGLVLRIALGAGPAPQPLLQTAGSTLDPVGVVLSNDSKTVYIADRKQGLLACDTDSQVCAPLPPLDVVPLKFTPLAQSSVFLVADRQTPFGSIVLFDSGSASLYFVPAGGAQ